MLENELIIRAPKVSVWKRLIFSITFGSFFTLIVYILKPNIYDRLNTDDITRLTVHLIWLFFTLIVSVLPIILRHIIHLNFKQSKIRHSYQLGLFTYHESWQDLVDLNYISIYKVGDYNRVNLWYEVNSILNLFTTKSFDEALHNAYHISDKFQIDLLDATTKGNHQWINKEAYFKTSAVTYL